MTPEQRELEEEQIKNAFFELQDKLVELKNEVQMESDDSKKQEKQSEIDKMERDFAEMKSKIDTLKSCSEQELQSLKNKLEEYGKAKQETQWEIAELKNEKLPTPTTYELLKDSETCGRLLTIISSNPNEFKNLPWDTAEKKLEYMFTKIRNSIVLFMKNKLWDSEKYTQVINNTIAPAFEWSLMEMLRDQGNEANVSMLKWMDKISFGSFGKLFRWVWSFAKKASGSYNKFSQWINAIDYLSVHNWVLNNPEKSKVLTNPLKFQEYINNSKFQSAGFSPYNLINENIFEVSDEENFAFWMSLQEKQSILSEIWQIQVVNNPKTTALIAKMIDKPEQFLQKTEWLQETANGLLEWVNSLNSVTKIFWVDILWEITKVPEKRSFLYRILDFVCKLIWITWWLEWIVKRWRLERMNLTDEKNENISQIFKEYKESAWENEKVTITDEASCKTVLANFAVTDNQVSSTRWDYLRDSIVDNIDISLVSPAVVQQILGTSYVKKEIIQEKWGKKERFVVDESKITESDKYTLARQHLINMKTYLEKYKDDSNNIDLTDFYKNISSTEDIALCITASLYADKDDVIEWVKAKVFLPENYWSVHLDWTVVESWGRENLDSVESSDKQKVSEQWIYDKAVEYWITDNRQIAYVLSTIQWESNFKNQKEIWWENRDYWKVDSTTGKAYYGRWFIQITHKSNYEKYTEIIRNSWKDFKDNDGNTLKWSEIDLVNNPDIILQSNDLAAFIAMDRMKNWWPYRADNKRLDYYINDNKQDYYNARIIINWMSSSPDKYASNAQQYLNKLRNWSIDKPPESKDSIFTWPELLAHNKDEIWWLGNSIMVWFQWYKNKLNFPNMDWNEWKNTQTHPNRFNSLLDVQWYKAEHPNVKSFMFYFGANTGENNKTLSDIKKWSEWFKEEWIQPVLCTCIWEDRHTWLTSLNQSIRDLWKEKDWPVFDFAKQYNKWDILMGWEGHPTTQWYSTMAWAITEQLQA